MKKKYIYFIIFLIFSLSVFLFMAKDEIIHFLINLETDTKYFKVLYIFLSFIYFLSPMPVTIIILLNGYLLKEYGFFVSIIQILTGSLILNLLSYEIKKTFKFDLKSKKIDFNKFSSNSYSLFISRLIIPYFLHNIYYGLIRVRLTKFLSIIILAEIPMAYALNQIGKSLAEINANFSLSIYSLLTDINFYIPFLIIFVLFIITNYLNKKNN